MDPNGVTKSPFVRCGEGGLDPSSHVRRGEDIECACREMGFLVSGERGLGERS